MNDRKDIETQPLTTIDQFIVEFLANNPELASALATFDVAQEKYRESLLAMTLVRVATSGSTNREV